MTLLTTIPLGHLIEVRGACWIWTGRTNESGMPIGRIGGNGKDLRIRPYLREKAGLPMIPRRRVFAKCLNRLCVSPACSAYATDPAMILSQIKSRTDRRGPDECHEWRGALDGGGYPVIYTSVRSRLDSGGCPVVGPRKTTRQVIRIIVESKGIKLNQDDVVSHLCENPLCCNPAHLMPATKSMNKRFSDLQADPKTRMTLEQAREWHRDEYRRELSPFLPSWLLRLDQGTGGEQSAGYETKT